MVGVGHPMRGDDYVGSFVAKILMEKIRSKGVVLFDVEDYLEFMISKITASNPKHVILVDACEMNASPGQVALIRLAETEYPFFTTHGIPLKLLAGKLLPDAETWLLAIQPERMEFNEALSPAVFTAATSISSLIAETLMGGEANA